MFFVWTTKGKVAAEKASLAKSALNPYPTTVLLHNLFNVR